MRESLSPPYLAASEGWLDVGMTAEACRHAVERTPDGGTLTIHVPLSQRWVVEGLHGPVDTLAADRGITLVWDVYCASQDGRSAPMERARKIAQLGVAAYCLDVYKGAGTPAPEPHYRAGRLAAGVLAVVA
jgi:hypothetical protein